VQIVSGAPMNEAILSGNLDFASGGVGPLLTIWGKTRGNIGVKGVAALNSMPLYLNTINPNVKSIADFTSSDRIALPAVKVSIQAITLQMAAEKAFGPGQHGKLDPLTVSLSHPDGMAAMLGGRSEVTAHFTSAPFMYQELDDKRVEKVLSSYDVLGGPHTFNVVWANTKFVTENPKVVEAFIAALDDVMQQIAKDPAGRRHLGEGGEFQALRRLCRTPPSPVRERVDDGPQENHDLCGFHAPRRHARRQAGELAGGLLPQHP